jgi:hypothetical protein
MSNNASNNASMPAFTPIVSNSLRSSPEEQQTLELEQEEKQIAILLGPPPVLRRERHSDYITPTPPLVRQDTLLLEPLLLEPLPVLRRERPEDYIFLPNSFISPDRIHNIQMPGTPVANRTSDIDLGNIRPRRLNFN